MAPAWVTERYFIQLNLRVCPAATRLKHSRNVSPKYSLNSSLSPLSRLKIAVPSKAAKMRHASTDPQLARLLSDCDLIESLDPVRWETTVLYEKKLSLLLIASDMSPRRQHRTRRLFREVQTIPDIMKSALEDLASVATPS